jgi:hypothetical protein
VTFFTLNPSLRNDNTSHSGQEQGVRARGPQRSGSYKNLIFRENENAGVPANSASLEWSWSAARNRSTSTEKAAMPQLYTSSARLVAGVVFSAALQPDGSREGLAHEQSGRLIRGLSLTGRLCGPHGVRNLVLIPGHQLDRGDPAF